MDNTVLQLNIISAEKSIFSGRVSIVTLPGVGGKFSVLPEHAPLVSTLNSGIVSYETEGSVKEVEIKGGFVEVKQNVVTVCVE
ncbi:ATP synthase F1 subunit epsilon [Dysgonomonas sp. 216]|uniref:ATP synthase F1 subunit epsilon n=1 Tax=Dysgonomonas sp. 216 TaxID=2302934 RepID=UPI0013D360A1|nr:ATP synthase F1 subunit epsilon [Dysgonomonas sp. 216]NDW19374.1 ATP synthase F1 subunit epsilon [Dysgonomonas sp. 216]